MRAAGRVFLQIAIRLELERRAADAAPANERGLDALMASYTVTAERAGDWWVLQAIEAPGAISQVASLDQADQIIEAIAFVTGEPADHIEIRVQSLEQ